MDIYTYVSATYHYVVFGCMPASREDVLVVCLASVHTTHYILPFLTKKTNEPYTIYIYTKLNQDVLGYTQYTLQRTMIFYT